MAAVFALYGDTERSLELKSQAEPTGTVGRLNKQIVGGRTGFEHRGEFDEAEQHLVILTSVVRDFAIPNGEAGCRIGFAKVALDRGDPPRRALGLLAAVKASVDPEDHPFRSTFDALVYAHSARILRNVLDPDSADPSQADRSASSLKESLDDELSRRRTSTAATN